ncbi:MAG TPA: YciI family protein [Spirochaetia bacterium]|nr:YciI family protein [Spirochaetia bacterium]
MKYLLLFCVEDAAWRTISKEEADAIRSESDAYDEGLRKSGHLMFVQRLQPAHTATTVRVRARRPSYTDGPFAETKEQLAGVILLDAKDLEEALSIASRSPLARIGSVEVRPGLPAA